MEMLGTATPRHGTATESEALNRNGNDMNRRARELHIGALVSEGNAERRNAMLGDGKGEQFHEWQWKR